MVMLLTYVRGKVENALDNTRIFDFVCVGGLA
jgi:hypothetical protein